MANILLAIESPDLGRLSLHQGNVLAGVEKPDTAAFYFGSTLAAIEASDQAAIDVIVNPIILAVTETQDVGAIDIKSGLLTKIQAVEAKDSASFHVEEGILIEISAVEQLDQAAFNGYPGNLASLLAVESGDTGLVTFSPDTHLILAATENPDEGYIAIQEVPITFVRKAIVMHLFNYAVSHYMNFNFNSMFHFNGLFLATNEDGVYILGGADDLGEPIMAEIGTGVNDLGKDGAIEIPREAWLSYRSDNGMELDTKVDEARDLATIFFQKVTRAIKEERKKFGRGIKGRFFTWKLKNVNGSDFSLESLRILGDVIKRKTR